MSGRNARAKGIVPDIYYSMTPSEFLDLVAKSGGLTACARAHGGASTTWMRWKERAEKESGLRVVFGAQGKPGVVVDSDEEEVTPEVDETLRESLDELPDAGKPKPLTKDVKQLASDAMATVLEDDPVHDGHGGDSGPLAMTEDIPRVFVGGIVGGASEKPGKGASAEELDAYYLQETDVAERVHRARLRTVPGKDYAVLHPIADVHLGDRECDYRRAVSLMDWIGKHEGHYAAGLGDYFQAPTTSNVRSATLGFQSLTMSQCIQVGEMLFRRLERKGQDDRTALLLLGVGNHEQTILRSTGQDLCPAQWMCERLNVPYAPYDFPLILDVGEQTYTVYMHHGTGSGATWGAYLNSLERLANNCRADAVVMAHSHVKAFVEKGIMQVKKDADGNDVWEVGSIPMIRAGSFQRYHTGGYARGRNLPPSVPGTVAIRLYGSHFDIHARM